MKLTKDGILIEKIDENERSQSGLLIISTSKTHKTYRGRVILIGPKALATKVGDIVRYNPNSAKGFDVDYHGKKCLLLREDGDLILNESKEHQYSLRNRSI